MVCSDPGEAGFWLQPMTTALGECGRELGRPRGEGAPRTAPLRWLDGDVGV